MEAFQAAIAQLGAPASKVDAIAHQVKRTLTENMERASAFYEKCSRLIDYVITHELCHLAEPNHGQPFYQLPTRLMPDWRARKDDLDTFDFG